MPRIKKDAHHINYYIDRHIYEKLHQYAEKNGQTQTMAIERILTEYFDETEKKQIDEKAANTVGMRE